MCTEMFMSYLLSVKKATYISLIIASAVFLVENLKCVEVTFSTSVFIKNINIDELQL